MTEARVHTIALVGGTGPEGRGLATRFALAGRDPQGGTTLAYLCAGFACLAPVESIDSLAALLDKV